MNKELQKIFEESFAGYAFPWENANEKIVKLPKEARAQYFEDADTIVSSETWKMELAELRRHYFHFLAFKADGERKWSEADAYRLAILAVNRLEARMKILAQCKGMAYEKITEQLKYLEQS